MAAITERQNGPPLRSADVKTNRAAATVTLMMVLTATQDVSAQPGRSASGAAGASGATLTLEHWRTTWITESGESITASVVTSRTLPRTLSIDGLSATEIERVRQEVYDTINHVPPIDRSAQVSAADNCMQWIFHRWDRTQPWRAVGFQVGKRGLMKLNGALRRVELGYTISYRVSELFGWPSRAIVEDGLTGGSARISVFSSHDSYRQADAAKANDDALRAAIDRGEYGPRSTTLLFGSTDRIEIVQPDAPCSLLKARCRRYEFKATRPAEWQGFRVLDAPQGTAVREPIAALGAAPMEFAIEDMCPFVWGGAMIERQYSRREGPAAAAKRFGLRGNAALRDALKPYVKQRLQ